MARYRYFITDDVVICVSRFAGKAVRGIAKCQAPDSFDEETGKKLARLRCDLKVAQKRHKRANDKEIAARKAVTKAKDDHSKAMAYFVDSLNEQEEAKVALEEFEAYLKSKN